MNDLKVQQIEMPILRVSGRVMLPHVTRLLRVAAPRVQVITPALRGSRLLAVAIEQHSSLPATRGVGVEPVCVCQVLAVRRLAGAIRLLIRGESRGLWFSTSAQHGVNQPHGKEQVEVRPDELLDPPTIDREHRCEELRFLVERCIPGARSFSSIRTLLEQASLGPLCDLIADCIGLGMEQGLQLLSATNVELRSDILLDELRRRVQNASDSTWLSPSPSAN